MASPGVVTLVIGQIRCAIIHRRHAPCTLHPQVGRRGAARSGPLVGAPHQRPAPATTAARALATPHAQPAQPSTLLARPRIISGAGDGDGDSAAAPVKLFWPISLARPTRPAYPPPVRYDGSLLLTSRTNSHSGQKPARDRPRRPLPLLGAVRLARDDSARTPFSRHLSCTAPALLPDLLACTVAATTAAALQPSQPEPYGTHLPSAQSHAFPDLHHHPDPPDDARFTTPQLALTRHAASARTCPHLPLVGPSVQAAVAALRNETP